jgi:hypothetical protein
MTRHGAGATGDGKGSGSGSGNHSDDMHAFEQAAVEALLLHSLRTEGAATARELLARLKHLLGLLVAEAVTVDGAHVDEGRAVAYIEKTLRRLSEQGRCLWVRDRWHVGEGPYVRAEGTPARKTREDT